MRRRAVTTSLVLMVAALGGCGGGARHRHHVVRPVAHLRAIVPAAVTRRPARATATRAPEALVTTETGNRVIVVNLVTGRVMGGIPVPGGPEYVDGVVTLGAVSSPQAGTVSIIAGPRWHVTRADPGFAAPHIVAFSPDGEHVYVTDDRRGTFSVITLTTDRVTGTVFVGHGAHHLASAPDQQRVWVALGESARRIVIVDTRDLGRPTVIGSFDPGFAAHDLAFSPSGRQVWVTSAAGPDVAVLRAADHRLLFRVHVGAPPQHVAFLGRYAYLTSGYGRTVEQVDAATGAIVRHARVPYGSFELAAGDGFVVTASLLDGDLATFTPALRLRRVRRLAPETRDVAIVEP